MGSSVVEANSGVNLVRQVTRWRWRWRWRERVGGLGSAQLLQ